MPPPAQKDAMSRMGLSRKPVFEIFGMSDDVAKNPMFGQQIRQDAWEDLGTQVTQKQVDNQLRGMEAAEGYFNAEPSTRQKFLEDNPQIVNSPQFGRIAQYQRMMPSAADKTLMPQLALKLPPGARAQFAEGVNSGMGVLNAYTAAQDFVEQQELRDRVYGTGATDDDIKRAFPDGRFTSHDAARFEAQRKLATSKDPELAALQNYAMSLARQKKLMWDTSGETDPELETEWQSVTGLLNEKLKAKAFPAAPQEKVTDKVTVVDPADGEKITLRDTLAKINGAPAGGSPPSVQATDDEVKVKVKEHMNSPEADEDFFSNAVVNPRLPPDVRAEALDKFREFVKNPPAKKGLTLGDAIARREGLQGKLKEAERLAEFPEEATKYAEAWTKSKGELENVIDKFSESMSVDRDEMINSLAKDESIKVPKPGGRPEYVNIRKLLSDFWADRLGVKGDMLKKSADLLEPFSRSKFAKELGESRISLPGFPRFGEKVLAQGKTYGDVLDVLLEEKKSNGRSAPASPPDIPTVKSAQEASKLPPGSMFRTPDGRVMEVPSKD